MNAGTVVRLAEQDELGWIEHGVVFVVEGPGCEDGTIKIATLNGKLTMELPVDRVEEVGQ